jgi:hypothetical protein
MRRSNIICLFLLLACISGRAQQVTGFWKGKINRRNVEVKIVQNGDSLTGTSYYYESAGRYRRYTIKGYFDPNTNSIVWWDDQLVQDRGGNGNALLSVADFNCPGGGAMQLDGKSSPKEDRDHPKGSVNLTKVSGPSFPDEWDYVIDNYTVGGNDPDLIDSISTIALHRAPPPPSPVSKPAPVIEKPKALPPVIAKLSPPLTVEEKFKGRAKTFTKDIPVTGDSIELRFYDNAEIDGDSISLFLNGQLLFSHVRLSDKAYTIKLSVKSLSSTNELVMVAENLGSIPPNTSYMVALVGDQRYDAQLASTEQSSAMIRLLKN